MVTTTPLRQSSLIRREDLEFEVLSLLISEPEISQRELARRLGASLGRINSCVQTMIESGNMKRDNTTNDQTGAALGCAVTDSGMARRAALAGSYLLRKRAELDRLAGQIAAFGHGAPLTGAGGKS